MCGLVIKFRCFVQRRDGYTLITHTCKVQLERFKLLLLRRRRRANKLHTQTRGMPAAEWEARACWLESHTDNATNATSQLDDTMFPPTPLWDGYWVTVLQQRRPAARHALEGTLSALVSLSADSQHCQSLFMRVRICCLDKLCTSTLQISPTATRGLFIAWNPACLQHKLPARTDSLATACDD